MGPVQGQPKEQERGPEPRQGRALLVPQPLQGSAGPAGGALAQEPLLVPESGRGPKWVLKPQPEPGREQRRA